MIIKPDEYGLKGLTQSWLQTIKQEIQQIISKSGPRNKPFLVSLLLFTQLGSVCESLSYALQMFDYIYKRASPANYMGNEAKTRQ